MKRIPIKLRTINVIELLTQDNVVDSIRSFNTTPKGIKAAEKLFKKFVQEDYKDVKDGVYKEDLDMYLEEGYYECSLSERKIIIQWS